MITHTISVKTSWNYQAYKFGLHHVFNAFTVNHRQYMYILIVATHMNVDIMYCIIMFLYYHKKKTILI